MSNFIMIFIMIFNKVVYKTCVKSILSPNEVFYVRVARILRYRKYYFACVELPLGYILELSFYRIDMIADAFQCWCP